MNFSQITSWIQGNPIRMIIAVVIFCALLVVGWLYVTKGVNGISSFFFFRAASKKQAEVDAKLLKAEQQQAVIDQTLRDLAAAKGELKAAQQARAEAEKVFNDQSKTAKEKVAAFESVMSAAPVRTDPNGVTAEDLCARAKAAASNPELIAALCVQ